ncbi:MAG: ABC-type transport auxiliary lipoprotein family protein [Steroidobacteraceae bacterium]
MSDCRRNSRRTLRLLALVMPALALLPACSGGLRRSTVEPVTYVLRAAGTAAAAGAPATTAAAGALTRPTLGIARVLAQPGYAGEHVLLTRPDRSLDFYAGARWPDALPEVVATLAAETLRASGALRAVHDDAAPFTGEYTLRITIRRFDAEYAGESPPSVRVSLECTVARVADRSVLAAFRAESAAPAAGNRLGAVVAAFEQAAQAALAEVSARTLAAIGTDAVAAQPGGTAAADAAAPAAAGR